MEESTSPQPSSSAEDNCSEEIQGNQGTSNNANDSDPSSSCGSSQSKVITPEGRARMERNRQAALKRLKDKSAAVNEVLAAYGIDNDAGPSAKKRKKESQYMTELKNVVSEGSVVRVHGTKLIDTGGGFLIEEKDLVEQEEAEKIIVPHEAPYLPTDVPHCMDCEKEFQDSFLFKNYEFPVCDSCKDIDEKHKLITRTDAKNEYLLKDVDLDKREPILKFVTKPNPHNSNWGDMKLYLRLQVEERAIEVWGSLDRIDEQQEMREENRMKTKIKKYNKKMKDLRMSARSSLYTKDFKPHEHIWGPEVCVDEDEDQYQHTCTECGQDEIYEKM
ncbi:DNA repair protein [Orchesella cincta]|uniref:DNA repair protein n=1 Tax=Orchesella cincta TaxID=48709 RepID=A0A1D2NHB1_ORCCI|nr:DNA repair protein [Orchesella cincta]